MWNFENFWNTPTYVFNPHSGKILKSHSSIHLQGRQNIPIISQSLISACGRLYSQLGLEQRSFSYLLIVSKREFINTTCSVYVCLSECTMNIYRNRFSYQLPYYEHNSHTY